MMIQDAQGDAKITKMCPRTREKNRNDGDEDGVFGEVENIECKFLTRVRP
jgi:hypothetical protein